MTTPPTTVSAVLLVDQRIQDYETIVSAAKSDVRCVVFDPNQVSETCSQQSITSFQYILSKIAELGVSSFANIGVVQHNRNTSLHQFFGINPAELSTVAGVEASDPTLQTWSGFAGFITSLKTTYGVQNVDLMACALYSNPDWKYVIDTLATQTGVVVRASTDDTGSAAQGGNWFLESHTGVNLKTVYFTDAIDAFSGLLKASYELRQKSTKGFATGSTLTWGTSGYGGNSSSVSSSLTSGVVAVYSTGNAFAALKSDGSVITWGDSTQGGSSSSVSSSLTSGVVSISSTGYAFAALKSNGSVITWGDSGNGGNSSSVASSLTSGVVEVYSNIKGGAFAALKSDGSVITWGNSTHGGNSSSVASSLTSGVIAIYTSGLAFTALKSDGSVVSWGYAGYSVTSFSSVASSLTSGVVAVYSSERAFAALKSDGRVITWGDSDYGANSTSVASSLTSGVITVYSNMYAFAALKSDGSVITWGSSSTGGDSSSVASSLTSGVISISSNMNAFAALKNDGSVIVWGNPPYGAGGTGGDGGGSSVSAAASLTSGVVAIYSTDRAFAAIKTDGSVVTWGYSSTGGSAGSLASSLTSGVVAVYSTGKAFAALKNDGRVITWGHSNEGGDSSSVSVSSGVVSVYSAVYAFAVIKTTATTFDLSMSYYTDMDRFEILRQKENRRRVDLTNLNNNVFTLSTARDLTFINPNIPSGKILRIIVPVYTSSSSYSITSTATIPSGTDNFIIACNEGEPVTISGVNYVNFGSYVYKRETNNTYTKLTSATFGGYDYDLYGGDGVNSSGIVLLARIPTLSNFGPFSILSSTGTYTLPKPTSTLATTYGSTWAQVGGTINGQSSNNYFGSSLCMSTDGTTVIVGAPQYPNPRGYAGVYKNISGTWTLLGSLLYGDTQTDQFGDSVSISADGTIIAVGAIKPSGIGYVKVYKYITNAWVQQGSTITGGGTNFQNGCSVSLSANGKIIAIGEKLNTTNGSNAGRGRVFSYDEANTTWNQLGGDMYGPSGAWFGHSISLSSDGSIVAIGGPQYNTTSVITGGGNSGGIVRIFQYDSSKTTDISNVSSTNFGPIGWNRLGGDFYGLASAQVGGFKGLNISSDGTMFAVGYGTYSNRGLARIFKYNPSKSTNITTESDTNFGPVGWYRLGQDLITSVSEDSFGCTASLSNDGTIVSVGGLYIDSNSPTNNNNVGGVKSYSYSSSNNTWSSLGQTLYGLSSFEGFGGSLGASGNGAIIAVGANGGDLNGTDSGYVKIYNIDVSGGFAYSSNNSSVADVYSSVVVARSNGTAVITAQQSGYSGYMNSSITANVIVGTSAPTYTFTESKPQSITKTFGDATFSLSDLLTGVSNSSGAYTFATSNSGAISIGGDGVTATVVAYNATPVTITATQAASGNYSASSTTLTITVVRKAPSYGTFTPPAKTFGAAPFSIVSFAPTSNSSGAYTYTSSAPGVATISSDGATVTIVSAGSTTITASQDICGNYSAGSKTGLFTVSAATPTYTPASPSASVTKTFGVDVSFSLTDLVAGISNSNGQYVFTTGSSAVTISSGVATIQAYTPSAITITATQDASGNYATGSTAISVLINRGTPTYQSVSQVTKTYGTDVSFSMATVMSGISNSNGAYTFSSAASEISISGDVVTILAYTPDAVTIKATQAADGNYTDSSANVSLLVDRKVPSYGAFSLPAVTYEDVPYSLVSYAPTSESNATYSYSSSNTAVATVNTDGTVVTIIGQGYTTITASQDISGNYKAGSTTASLLVNRAAPTFLKAFTIDNKTFGDAPFSLLPFTEGLDNTDGTYHFSSSDASVVSISTVDNVTATIHAYTPTTPVTIYVAIDACGNYAASTTSGTLTINRKVPAYQSVSTVAKTFGDAAFSLVPYMSGISESSGSYTFASSDASAVRIESDGFTATILAYTASAITITATQAASGNYAAGEKTFSMTVARRAPTIGALALGPLNGYYEVSDGYFTLTAPTSNSSGGFTYASDNSAVAMVVNTNNVSFVGNGTANIIATQDICGNYDTGSVSSLLRVGATVPTFGTFTVSSTTKTYGDGPFTLTPPTSNSDGAFTFTSSNSSRISISGTTATIVGGGTVDITASQDPSGSFTRKSVTTTFTVQRKNPTLSNFPAIVKSYSDGSFIVTAPETDGYNYFTYSSSNTGIVRKSETSMTQFDIYNGGSATITATSGSSDNYNSGTITATVTINPVLPNLTLSNYTRAFDVGTFGIVAGSGGTDGAISYASGDESVATISGAVVTIKKVGEITITATSSATSRYLSASASGLLTITRGTPTISNLYNETRTMTQAPFTLSPTSNSNGTFTYVSDNSGVVFMTNGGTTFNVASIGTATITATISQDTSGNYNSGNYSFTMSVIRATSTLSSSTFSVPVLMTYGDTPVNIITAPTSDSSGAITYTSGNVNIATIHPTTGLITAVGAGLTYFVASQAQTNVHYLNTVQSNYMQFVSKSVTQTRVEPYTSSTITKYYGDAQFQLSTVSESTASKLFTTNIAGVVNISTSSNIGYIDIINVGSVVITGQQFANSQYSTQNTLTWTLTVEKGTTTLSGLASTLSKNVTDAPFTVAVTSASAGTKSYALSNPDSSNVLVVNSSTGVVTLKGAGTATIVASQAASSLYNAPTSVSCVVTVAEAGTSLQGSTLTSARVFDNVDMTGASLSNTTVTGVSFAGATLTNAVLTSATVRNATLTTTNMVGATLTNADISGTSFAGAMMTRVTMTGATLTNSTLTSADLSGASMANTTITGSTLTSSTMTNAVLTGATLTNSTLTSAVLTGSSLVRANVTGSTFVGASLAGADMSGATVTNANFTNANISGANITNVAFSPLQKIQLLKNTNNRAISGIQVGDVSGSVVLAAISGASPAVSIPNIASAAIKVVIPTTSTVSSAALPNVVLDTTTSDKFYFPINEGEYFQILGVKYYTDSGVVKNAETNATVEVISYGSKSIWLIAGSVIASVLAVNTISESTFTVPSGKLDTDAPFNITVAPTSNSDAPIVYSSNHTSVATIHPSTGLITIHSQGYVSFTATQAATLLYEAGSKTSNELHVNKLVNFSLPGLDQSITMATSGLLDASAVSLETTDATAVFYVKLSDMTDIFKYQTDSFDMNENDASDVKYYVFNRKWPAALKINPAHAMMNKTESNGMLGTVGLFDANKMLAKHDFLRYLSLKLFNTIHGVDLFNNETDLLENATYWGEDVRTNIRNILTGISTTSSDATMSYDASGNKYLTNSTTSNTNLCRELVRQLLAGASSRFGNIANTNLPQGIPLIEGDTINFKITFNPAPSQDTLTGVEIIPSRSYMVKLVMKSTITGSNENTPVIDSEMYPNAYPYSSSVVSYAATESSSAVYNIYSPPAPMPFARFGFDGWYYTNSTAWVTTSARNHIKWLLPPNSGSSTVGSLLYIRANLKIHNKVALPYIMVYTTANSARKYPVTNTGALANGGVYSFYVNFNSYTTQPAMIGYTNAALSNTTGNGSFASNEVILNIALETDSSAGAGTVDFTLSSVIIGDASGEKEYGFEADVPTAYP
jgi:uncharacterized protein YjbI with pentapeptide repeats